MYVLIKDFTVSRYNMVQSQVVLAPIPLMAVALFAHALSRRACFEVSGFGLVVHAAEPLVVAATEQKGLRCPRSAAGIAGLDKVGAASAQPDASASGRFSVILKTDDSASAITIQNALRSMRLAGGVIQARNRGAGAAIEVECIPDMEGSGAALLEAFRKVPVGRLVLSARNVVEARLAAADGGCTIADAVCNTSMADAARWELDRDADEPEYPECKAVQLIPLNMGYALLEAPVGRKGARLHPDTHEPLLHAGAEPLLGLASLVSVRSFTYTMSMLLQNGYSTLPEDFLWTQVWLDSPSRFELTSKEAAGCGLFFNPPKGDVNVE